jgi:predicted esterase
MARLLPPYPLPTRHRQTPQVPFFCVHLDMPFTYIAPRAHPTGGYNWFPVGVENRAFRFEALRLTEAVDSLAAFIAAAAERYQADPRRVVFVGYS